MFSINLFKVIFLFALLCSPSCRLWQDKTDATPTPTPFTAEELESEIPFPTKEPESFQTEISVAVVGGAEEKFFAAKSGTSRLIVFNYQEEDETMFLQTGENQNFSVARRRKIYAEIPPGFTAAETESINDFLTADLLNRKADAKFERLAAENNLVRYRVRLDDAQKSEIVIYVDEEIGLPVKQEFYSVAGEQKNLTLTVTLNNFSLQPGADVFEVPKDCRKVSIKEFTEILRRGRSIKK